MASIQLYSWTHRCLNSINISVNISKISGGPINLSKDIRIQGINPPLVGQEGILCTHIVVNNPIHGTLEYTGTGWYYIPNTSAITSTSDLFGYKLSYIGQDSPTAFITIHLI